MKLSTSLIFSAAFASTLSADISTNVPQKDPNPSNRYGINEPTNWFVSADFLYLKPLVQFIAKTTESTGTNQGLPVATSTISAFQQKFSPGVRALVGYNTNYDGWDVFLNYTGFYYKRTNSTIDDISYGSMSYKCDFTQTDLDLGRMYAISKHLSVRPHVGIRGIWLAQKLLTNTYSNFYTPPEVPISPPVTSNSKASISSYIFGIESGCEATWQFSKYISLFSHVTASMLSNSQNTRVTGISLYSIAPGEDRTRVNYNSRLILGADLNIGLRFDRNYSSDQYHFSVSLGYEQHALYNLNTFVNLIASAGGFANQDNDISSLDGSRIFVDQDFALQGISLSLRLDF